MKTFYFFPFTHLSEVQASTLECFFSGVGLLSLGRETESGDRISKMKDSGLIHLLPIPEQRAAEVDKKVKSYVEWAKIHKGNERNLKALARETDYLKDDSGPTAILSQIRCAMNDRPVLQEGTKEKDPLLFLRFAQIWDQENEAIQKELTDIETSSSALFAELKGEIDPLDDADLKEGGDDPGRQRTQERILAWSKVASEAGLSLLDDETCLLLTTSQAVLDWLIEDADQVINGLDIESIKVHHNDCDQKERWQKELYAIFDRILETGTLAETGFENSNSCCSLSGRIRFCLFPGGELNRKLNIPGRQVGVCLVELNS
ncbi:MAG: hypothetical protein HUK40_19830 [Desulfobacter sp.]|nr:hypothetical protein [Desulfobacter sp.]WDP86522.1 MAG: hypothetical protein HUN05_16505 [Desulfobacter sp.]